MNADTAHRLAEAAARDRERALGEAARLRREMLALEQALEALTGALAEAQRHRVEEARATLPAGMLAARIAEERALQDEIARVRERLEALAGERRSHLRRAREAWQREQAFAQRARALAQAAARRERARAQRAMDDRASARHWREHKA